MAGSRKAESVDDEDTVPRDLGALERELRRALRKLNEAKRSDAPDRTRRPPP